MASNHRKPGVHNAWTTITYRSVALLVLALGAVWFILMWLAFPQFAQNMLEKAGDVSSTVLEKVAGMAPATGTGVVSARQANFTPLDGTVRVKKGNGNTGMAANYHIPLEDDECSWLPPSHLPQSVFFLYTRGQKVNTAAVTVTNLGEGLYYWRVRSYDAAG